MTEVDQNDAAFTFDHDEDELVTYGVGPCIAVAIVNKTRGFAGLCHFDNAHHRLDELQRFLAKATEAGDADDLVEVMIGGGDTTDPDTAAEVNQARAAALASVRASFPGVCPPLWLDSGGAYNVTVVASSADIWFEPGAAEWTDEP